MKHRVIETTLDNGAKGLLVDVEAATVMTCELNFRAGDFLSPRGKWEVAHILEHMVFGANKEYPKARLFQAELQKNGAYMNASTSPYNLNYSVESADFEWDRVLNLVQTSLESPLLSEDEFRSERGNVIEELTGDLNHNFKQVLVKARQKFGLVALSDKERLSQIPNISAADIRSFYRQSHVSGNLRFIVAGKIADRQGDIEKIFSELQIAKGKRIKMPDEKPTKFKDIYYLEKPDLENIYFFFTTFANGKLTQREEDALNIVNVMLTGTLHSRILGEARERGLAYHIASNFAIQKDSFGWWFGAELTPNNAPEVFDIIVTELKRILDGKIDDEDFESAQQYSLGRYQRSAQSVGGVLAGYAASYFYDGRIEDYYGFPDRIKSLKKAEVVQVVRRMFADEVWGLTVMGTDKKAIAKKLNTKLAKVWEE